MSDSVLSSRPANGSWSRNPALRIEYAAAVLEEIRRTIQEGFHKIPHGGVETGGLLYGKWDGALLTIAAWRPIQCEHPLGPRFQLSRDDEKELAVQLAEPVPELEQYQPVGWFASHSRGALQLRGPDIDLHAKYFPDPWQPILLLCASRSQPMQAAFYTRLEGTLTAGLEVSPFEVVPNPTAVPRRERRAPQNGPRTDGLPERRDPRRERRRSEAAPGDATHILAARMGPLPDAGSNVDAPPLAQGPEFVEHGSGSWSPIDPGLARGPWLSRGYERVEDDAPGAMHDATIHAPREPLADPAETLVSTALDGEPAPKFLGPPIAESAIPWKRLAWAALWLVIAGAGVYTIPRWSAPPKPDIDLQAREVAGAGQGQMTIRWKLNGSGTAGVTGGALKIADGSRERTLALSPKEWEAGSVTYWRQAKQVDVRLALQVAGGDSLEARAHFTGAEPASTPVEKSLDLPRLRNTLQDARRQGRKLERLIALQERRARTR